MRPKTIKEALAIIERITDAVIYEQVTTQDQTTINVLREEMALAQENLALVKRKLAKRNQQRRELDQVKIDSGLVRGKDSTGKTIWE